MITFRSIGYCTLLFFSLWTIKRAYSYFCDYSVPSLTFVGIHPDKCYAGDVHCALVGDKGGTVSLWLDGQPLVSHCAMSLGSKGYDFTIPTRTIANGKHSIKAEIVDNTYRKNKRELEQYFYVDNIPLQVALVKSDVEYKVFQGRTLHVQFQVNKEIEEATIVALSHTYHCFPESKGSLVYETFIPISCEEAPNEYLFSIDVKDKVGNGYKLDNKFQVVMYPFKKQGLQISAEKVKEEEEIGRDHKELEDLLADLAQKSPQQKLWRGAFCAPIEIQRVSTEFGTVRTTQHKGRYAHTALDVINLPKSVVWATQNGVVVLKDRFSHTGNTVIIDHGMGILSMFCHLDSFAKIEEGELIAKGNPVGTIGKTGYASGYHLHWEMRLNNIPVDPMQWTKAIF